MDNKPTVMIWFKSWEEKGYLALIWALLFELLANAFVAFAGLVTLETLLPTFITARLSLAKLLFFLLLGSSLLAWLGTKLHLEYPRTSLRRSPLVWITCLWGIALFFLSMIKLPLWSIPLFLLVTGAIGIFFFKLFFEDQEEPE